MFPCPGSVLVGGSARHAGPRTARGGAAGAAARTYIRPPRRGRDLLILLPPGPADRWGVRWLRQGPDACHPQRRRRSALPGLLDAARPHLRLLRHCRPGQGQGRGRCALPAVLPAASATPAAPRNVRRDPGDLPAGHRRQPRPLRELQRPATRRMRGLTPGQARLEQHRVRLGLQGLPPPQTEPVFALRPGQTCPRLLATRPRLPGLLRPCPGSSRPLRSLRKHPAADRPGRGR
jgi:hypothetical protein